MSLKKQSQLHLVLSTNQALDCLTPLIRQNWCYQPDVNVGKGHYSYITVPHTFTPMDIPTDV